MAFIENRDQNGELVYLSGDYNIIYENICTKLETTPD